MKLHVCIIPSLCIVIKFGVAVNYHLVDIVYNVNLHVSGAVPILY